VLPGDASVHPRLEMRAVTGAPEGLAEGGRCLQICNCLSGAVFLILPCRKGPVEAKSECQESEAKPAPAEVKTVPNDATQTKENDSKA
jgi:hypothetical protein